MKQTIILREKAHYDKRGELIGISRLCVDKADIIQNLKSMEKENVSKNEKKAQLQSWGFKDEDINNIDAEGWL